MEITTTYDGTLQDAMNFLDRFEDAHIRDNKPDLTVTTREAQTTPPDGYSVSWKLATVCGNDTHYNQGLVSLAKHNPNSTVIQIISEDNEPCQRYADKLRTSWIQSVKVCHCDLRQARSWAMLSTCNLYK